MNRADAEEFTESIGQIAGGTWRAAALGVRLGVPASLGLDPRDWVLERLGGYARLTAEDRREAVAELAAEGMSQRDISEALGIGLGTVNRTLHEGTPDNPVPFGTVDAYGQPVTGEGVPNGTPPGRRVRVTLNTGEVEWYTPGEFVDPARVAMGGIDLDPASCQEANAVINASAIWTASDNGLDRPWSGRVWLNPPYSMSQQFGTKLLEEYGASQVKQACVLVNNATDTQWFHDLAEVATSMVLIEGRIPFWAPGGRNITHPTQGQIILYLGGRKLAFANAYRDLGVIVEPQ